MPFSAAEVGNQLSREEFDELAPSLRVDLVNAQYDLKEQPWSLVVLLVGDDGPACEKTIDLIHEWMDIRCLDTHVYEPPDERERGRPAFRRYWERLPPNGRSGVFVGNWLLPLLSGRVTGEIDDRSFVRRCEYLRNFEEMLRQDGTEILKFWLHLPEEEHEKRIDVPRKAQPGNGVLTKHDKWIAENYDGFTEAAADLIRQTGNWVIVESGDREYRSAAVATAIRDALRRRLDGPQAAPAPVLLAPFAGRSSLAEIDLTRELERSDYKKRLASAQQRFCELALKAESDGLSTVLAFEGWDAAGKGGVIRRMTQALPARLYQVVSISAPSALESSHHYLWRFWQRIPRAGKLLFFDRSWYGRVLVERVEGFATEAEWQRAYEEINDFEAQLVEHGAFAKFWLQIDEDEQKRRFDAREKTDYKKYKITAEDYRNRAKREQYGVAVDEMIARTSTEVAPWRLVAANDKRHARVEVLEAVIALLEARLQRD